MRRSTALHECHSLGRACGTSEYTSRQQRADSRHTHARMYTYLLYAYCVYAYTRSSPDTHAHIRMSTAVQALVLVDVGARYHTIISYHYHTIYYTIHHHAISHHIRSYRTMLYHTLPHRAVPCYTMLYHPIPQSTPLSHSNILT